MRSVVGILASICGILWISAAQATVRIHIDLSSQTMNVESANGSYTWPVSTARSGYVTPHGTFHPYSLQRMHYSRKYHMSPMPYSIFFARGYAIHGTYSVRQLGRPASHGCIRLSPGHAAELYAMVQSEGADISISGTPPHSRAFAERRVHRRHLRAYYRAPRGYYPAPRGYAPVEVPGGGMWEAYPSPWR